MDLDFTSDQLAFRDEVRGWLAENLPDEPLPSLDTPEGFELHREWEGVLHEARWSVVAWPEAYGGRDAGLVEWLLFEEEYYRSGAPGRVNTNGISLLGPTLYAFGTLEQQDRFLPRMASGEEIWAQGWSEPDSGSDLASISTKGIRDGEWFVLDGQKTWCSRGAWADWMFCIVRTDPVGRAPPRPVIPAGSGGLRGLGPPPGRAGWTASRRSPSCSSTGVGYTSPTCWATRARAGTWPWPPASSERGLNLRAPGRFLAAADRLANLYRELVGGMALTDSDLVGRGGPGLGRGPEPTGGIPTATAARLVQRRRPGMQPPQ